MKHTSIEQALLDLKVAGGSSVYVNLLLDELKNSPDIAKQSEELFKSHLYPQKNIDWIKYFNNIELERYISASALQVFMIMAKNMRTSNLIQISRNDLISITTLSKNTICKSLKELLDFGCIAIKIKGDNKNANVYMINPLLALVGTGNQQQLEQEFWTLTGSKYNYNELQEISDIHKQFLDTTNVRTYSLGYNKQITSKGTFIFNTINEPKVEIKSSSVTSITEESDDELPI